MKKIIVILILLFSSVCYADLFDYRKECPEIFEWTWYNTVLETAFIAVALTDLMQTYTFLYTDPHGVETNVLLGRHPSKTRFFTIAALTISGHILFAWMLPQPGRLVWQTIPTIIDLSYVKHNYNCGVRIKF